MAITHTGTTITNVSYTGTTIQTVVHTGTTVFSGSNWVHTTDPYTVSRSYFSGSSYCMTREEMASYIQNNWNNEYPIGTVLRVVHYWWNEDNYSDEICNTMSYYTYKKIA